MPVPTTGLVARYKASVGRTVTGDRVTAWADQSGNGNNAAAGTNAPWSATDYLGRPVVRFDGQTVNGASSMTLAAAQSFTGRDVSLFVVGRFAPLVSTVAAVGGPTAGTLRMATSATGQPILVNVQSRGSTVRVRSNPALFGAVERSAESAVYTNIENSTGLAATAVSAAGTGASLGATVAGGSNSSFDALEVLVYSRALTVAEVDELRAQMVADYGLRTTPYTKNIVFEGDSISQGTATGTAGSQFHLSSYPAQTLRSTTEDWKISNLGVSGAKITDLAARAAAADGYYDAAATTNVLMGLIGRNDAAVTGATASGIYADIRTYVQARVAAGFTVWWGTAIATGSSLMPIITELNSLLRGTPLGGTGPGLIADAGASRIVDFAALPEFDASTDTTNTAIYQPDATHPTPAGALLMADQVVPLMTAGATPPPAPSGAAVKTLARVNGSLRRIVRAA